MVQKAACSPKTGSNGCLPHTRAAPRFTRSAARGHGARGRAAPAAPPAGVSAQAGAASARVPGLEAKTEGDPPSCDLAKLWACFELGDFFVFCEGVCSRFLRQLLGAAIDRKEEVGPQQPVLSSTGGRSRGWRCTSSCCSSDPAGCGKDLSSDSRSMRKLGYRVILMCCQLWIFL